MSNNRTLRLASGVRPETKPLDSKQSSEIQARFLGVFFCSLCVQEIPAREVSQTTKRARQEPPA